MECLRRQLVVSALLLLMVAHRTEQASVGDLQVRLVGGSNMQEGRVEVRRYSNESWGTVCDDLWTDTSAIVVCKQLGLGEWGEARRNAAFGQGTGPIFLDDVSCVGTESNLGLCDSAQWAVHNCAHNEDAGVICHRYAVRLRAQYGGYNAVPYGSVEFLSGNTWVAICDSGWNDLSAKIACRMMGHVDGQALCCSKLSPYISRYLPSARNVTCSGTEPSLANCSYSSSTASCPPYHLASAVCYDVPKTSVNMSFSVRLNNGSSNWGRVEVRHMGVWGAVCASPSWNNSAASVVCKQLGLAGGVRLGDPLATPLEGSVWVTSLNCTGRETSLEHCIVSPWGVPVTYCRPAYVLCYTTSAPEVRLVGGGANYGRVEVSMDGNTYTVCDNAWSEYDATAVCRNLGFQSGDAILKSYYGPGSGQVALDTVTCSPTDTSLMACRSRGWLQTPPSCSDHSKDASAICFGAVRLKNGDHSHGVLTVKIGRRYSAICGTGFDDVDAKVACRQMGFINGIALPAGSYGIYPDSYQWRNLACRGNESSIFQCPRATGSCARNSYTNYASVYCFNTTGTPAVQSLSLEGGQGPLSSSSGRLVVTVSGLRGKVCPTYWDDLDARVACRQLGHLDGQALVFPNTRAGPYLLNDVECSGVETSIFGCQGNETCSLPFYNPPDAGVICFNDSAPMLQLVGGSSPLEGLVQVVYGGQAGTVCSPIYRRSPNIKVVCRQLGYVDGVYKEFSGGTGSLVFNDLACNGYESSIFMCRNEGLFGTPTSTCANPSNELGVSCFDSVRLVLTTQLTNDTVAGLVRMYYNSEWHFVCSDFFDDLEARVVCQKLGYSYYRALPKDALGRFYLDSVGTVTGLNCTGNERTLPDCPFRLASCPTSNYASVFCSKTAIAQGIQPTAPSSQPGSVLFTVDGLTSFVCPDTWNDVAATLYCKDLGYLYGAAMTPASASSSGFTAAWLISDVSCTGSENTVSACSFSTNASACASFPLYVAGVFCYNGQQDLQIRLAGGSVRYEGRVEVAINGAWGPVCDSSFTSSDAAVTCRTLGFLGGDAVAANTSGPVSAPYYFLQLRCTGSEAKLWHCPFSQVNTTSSFCANSWNVAAVRCTGEVRLEPGQTYGALEVLVNRTSSSYGLVCADNFTDREATVACRDLGFAYGIYLCCPTFDDVDLPIVRTAVACTGMEGLFSDCSYSESLTYCPSQQYAAIVCSSTPAGSGYEVQIQRVRNLPYGLVKVQHMGYWGYVCPNGFDNNDANVVCREAGFSGGLAFEYSAYRSDLNTALRWLSHIDCRGTESHLARCNNIVWGNISDCAPYGDAAALCYYTTAPQFHLVNGTNTTGRLEVWGDDGVGGTVCAEYWTDLEATVACKSLGFNSGRFLGAGTYGQGEGHVFIDYVDCTDAVSPQSLLDCYIWLYGLHDFSICPSHDKDAAVQCFDQVRLTGSKLATYGRVEVYVNSTWTAVCDQGFDQAAAQVVCQAVGFLYALPQCCSALGPLRGGQLEARQIGFKVNRCGGDEANLMDCDSSPTAACPSGRYASVLCSNNAIQELPLSVRIAGTGQYYGRVEVNRYGFWGPVCNSSWDDRDANATCHGLGYNYGVSFYATDYTGNPIVVGEFQCTGLEGSLASCAFKDIDDDVGCSQTSSRHNFRVTAGVLCYNTPGTILRLADGGPNYGRLELQFEGEWGRVADYNFNQVDADVACRQLGFGGGRSIQVTEESTGRVWMNYVSCRGYEKTLFECYSKWNYGGSYAEDAYVVCYNTTRLVNGNRVSVGTLEVNINNRWGTVCDHSWTATDTIVACRDLGYDNGFHLTSEPFGYSSYPIADNFQCTGTEAALSNCPHSPPDHSFYCTKETVSLACYRGPTPSNYTYRLNGGPTNNSGEVQVTFMNITGRICSDGWDDTDARVFCRELGFQTGQAFEHFLFTHYYSYSLQGPFWMADVRCLGSEISLADCPKTLGSVSQCDSRKSAGVTCLDSEGIYYRLGGSDSGFKGRVEVAVNGVWGTVCGQYFDSREATVFCRTLSFREGKVDYASGSYPSPPDTVYQAGFACTGNEDLLENCPHQGWRRATSSYCRHTNDAKVICFNDVRIGGPYDPTQKQGSVQFYNNGTWYNLCDTGFDDVSARRVCQDLSYVDGKAVCCSAYGITAYYIKLYQTNLNFTMKCRGTERDATECLRPGGCLSTNYASVVCFNGTDFADESYSFGFSDNTKTSGQVAVTHLGVVGRICNTFWDDADASVLCRSRGHADGIAFHYSKYNFQTIAQRGPFWLSGVNCTGSERSLGDCPFNDRLHLGNCSTAELAGALCFNDSGIQYRIVDPGNKGAGRVEISIGGVWGTVCDSYWDDRDASVLCRTLNYTDGYAVPNAHFGQGAGPVWLSGLRCQGSEKSLADCPHSGFRDEVVVEGRYSYGCRSHRNDASVVCNNKLKLNLGLNANMGAVMIYHQNAWTLICDAGFAGSDATIACRSFGFPHGTYVSGGVFGRVDAQIGITNVRCTGREKSLLSCPYDVSSTCSSRTYASVFCSLDPIVEPPDVKVRITRDTADDPRHGFVDVQVDGVWGAVCAAGFGNNEATVVCKELGFVGGVAYAADLHDNNFQKPILMSDVRCRGDEGKLASCPHTRTSATSWCDYYAPRAGVLCYNDTNGIRYRLAGDPDPTRGRMEVQYGGQWGLTCTWNGNYHAASVACRSLAYQDGLPISGLRYATSTKSWLYIVECQGNESYIPQCHTTGFNDSLGYYYEYFCSQNFIFSVQCYSKKLAITDLRLVGGDSNRSGRVEVFLQGPDQWGTVCDDLWDDVDATVVCNQLGFATGKAVLNAGFGPGSGRIVMDNVNCNGTERQLKDCASNGFGDHNCWHYEDAGVICSGVYVPPTTPTPSTTMTTSSTSRTPLPKTVQTDKNPVVMPGSLTASSSSISTTAIVVPIAVVLFIVVVVIVALLYRRRQGQKNVQMLVGEGGEEGKAGAWSGVSFVKGGAVRFVNSVRDRFKRDGGDEIKMGIANPGYDTAILDAGVSNPVYDITVAMGTDIGNSTA